MGNTDIKEIDAGVMDRSGRDMTNIGRILGMIATGLMALGLVLMLFWFVFAGFMVAAGAAGQGGSGTGP